MSLHSKADLSRRLVGKNLSRNLRKRLKQFLLKKKTNSLLPNKDSKKVIIETLSNKSDPKRKRIYKNLFRISKSEIDRLEEVIDDNSLTRTEMRRKQKAQALGRNLRPKKLSEEQKKKIKSMRRASEMADRLLDNSKKATLKGITTTTATDDGKEEKVSYKHLGIENKYKGARASVGQEAPKDNVTAIPGGGGPVPTINNNSPINRPKDNLVGGGLPPTGGLNKGL